MAKAKRSRKQAKKPRDQGARHRRRRERRFAPEQTHASLASVIVGMAGAGVLGAGVWAQWLSDQQHGFAPYLVAGGAVALAAGMWFGDAGAVPVRVGDAGVAIEKGADVIRVAWCDIKTVSVEKRNLIVRGVEATLTIPLGAHPKAAAWVLAEGIRRLPDIIDVRPGVVDSLPEPKKHDGDMRLVEGFQVTGRHCAASDKPISFERDARICVNCGQVYHKNHVPVTCETCEEPVGQNAIAPD
jgi:hypothetical protein